MVTWPGEEIDLIQLCRTLGHEVQENMRVKSRTIMYIVYSSESNQQTIFGWESSRSDCSGVKETGLSPHIGPIPCKGIWKPEAGKLFTSVACQSITDCFPLLIVELTGAGLHES